MAIRYLRRPPKPVGGRSKRAAPAQSMPKYTLGQPQEMPAAAPFFCAVCGREHRVGDSEVSDQCRSAMNARAATLHAPS